MKTIKINVYPFSELSEAAKNKALDYQRMINVNCQWYETVYAQAKTLGIEIEDFELGENYFCYIDLIKPVNTIISKILKTQSEDTALYLLAKEYTSILAGLYDESLEGVEHRFMFALRDLYLDILRKQYRHLTSDKEVQKAIESNQFTINGQLICS